MAKHSFLEHLEGHCDPASTCSGLTFDIRSCQNQGVKVFLSLGGFVGNYSLLSPGNVQEVFDYLSNNFLGGQSSSRPFGDVVLDGIDFDIESPGEFWDELVMALAAHGSEKKVYSSAAPSCYIPDPNLDATMKTGLFDYVWVQFYNDGKCEYGEY
ncbi:hypothetical protein L6452_06349 [Arctium lappa]|uniref:Uncharacterized protein n=1 Tax=Arctium lappa TaxID=4217 RepID=A0ACB9EIY2_ARCLA|nr:hypothetical protein L6452_06349 [Arctium lappa]